MLLPLQHLSHRSKVHSQLMGLGTWSPTPTHKSTGSFSTGNGSIVPLTTEDFAGFPWIADHGITRLGGFLMFWQCLLTIVILLMEQTMEGLLSSTAQL
jgi:hypothetical protein